MTRQGCFCLSLLPRNFDDRLSSNFHRFVILCIISWDKPTVKTTLLQWITNSVQCLTRTCRYLSKCICSYQHNIIYDRMYSVNLNVHDMMVCINIKRKPLKTNVYCDVRKPAEAIGEQTLLLQWQENLSEWKKNHRVVAPVRLLAISPTARHCFCTVTKRNIHKIHNKPRWYFTPVTEGVISSWSYPEGPVEGTSLC